MSKDTPAEAAPGSPSSPQPRTPAVDGSRLVRERRLANLRRNWHAFRTDTPAMIGAIVLLIFVLMAIFAPVIAPASMLDVTKQLDVPKYAPPSLAHPLGTDDFGREIWARIVWGSRVSLLVGVAATLMSMVIGTIMGLAAGHFTGIVGAIVMRLIDFFLVLPSLLLAIVLSTVLDRESSRSSSPSASPRGRRRLGSCGPRRSVSSPGSTSNGPASSAPDISTSSSSTSCPR